MLNIAYAGMLLGSLTMQAGFHALLCQWFPR